MSAAKHADVLFVKQKPNKENDLREYCLTNKIAHILFNDFSEALNDVKAVVSGQYTKEDVLRKGEAWKGF
jgi:2-hydroxy-3-keto-5-methylthiopentenyl-1-phosphate phosphatase